MHATLARSAALLLAAAIPMASAQTSTDCNPLDTTCPDDPAMGSSISTDFTAGASDDWTVTDGTISYDSTNGAAFVINEEGDAPTIETSDYFFFGTAEVVMQAASGTGIVSSIVLESDDLDEIDWEALGSYGTYIETDYFGKGYTGSYNRSTNADVDTLTAFHTYTVNWQKDSIQWLIDGSVVRTLTPDEAGDYYPQTPMRLKVGIWAGGDPSNAEGTIEWAGGETDYSDGPFTMYVKSVSITNANPGTSYTYSGNSGSDSSIVVNGAYSASASTSVAAATTTAAPSSTSSTSSSSSSTSTTSSSTSSAAETTTSAPPTTSTAAATTTAVSTTLVASTTPFTTFSSAVSTTPGSVSTPTPGLNTTKPASNSTATGTGSPSGTSTSTATTAPSVGAAGPQVSVTSSAVALYCFLFALVAYAL